MRGTVVGLGVGGAAGRGVGERVSPGGVAVAAGEPGGGGGAAIGSTIGVAPGLGVGEGVGLGVAEGVGLGVDEGVGQLGDGPSGCKVLSSQARLRSPSANVMQVERLAQKGSQSQGAPHDGAATGPLATIDFDHERRIPPSAQNGKTRFWRL